MKAKQRVTQTSVRTFRDCQRRYNFRYHECLEKEETPESLSFGTEIHTALEDYYNSILTPGLSIKAGAMMSGYAKCYRADALGKFEDWKVIAVEKPFEIPIINPDTRHPSRRFVYAGKIDLILQNDADELAIVDHKTSSRIDGDYIESATFSQQLYLYAAAVNRLYSGNVTAMYLNCLQKPLIRQKKDESENDFATRLIEWHSPDKYQRIPITFEMSRSRGFQRDLWQAVEMIGLSQKNGFWPRNTDSCNKIGQHRCPYFELCALNQYHLIDSVYIRKAPHQELIERKF